MVKYRALGIALIRQMVFCLNILRGTSHPINTASVTIFHLGRDWSIWLQVRANRANCHNILSNVTT